MGFVLEPEDRSLVAPVALARPLRPFMSHLATQLGYSAREFQALQLIALVAFGVVD